MISEFLKIIVKQNSSQVKRELRINRDIKQQNKFSTILYKNAKFINDLSPRGFGHYSAQKEN